MSESLSFNEILAELQNNKQETKCGKFIFKELTLNQQRKILNSTYEAVEIPVRISNIYNDYISDSVVIEDDMTNILHAVTVDKKMYLLNVLRTMSLGNEYVKSQLDDNEDESDENIVYTLHKVTKKDLESKIKVPEDIKFGDFSIKLNLPTLSTDKMYNSLLLNALKPFKKKKISDADLGAVSDVYQVYELMKFIHSFTYKRDTKTLTFSFDEITSADKIKFLNSLPRSVADKISDYIRLVRDCDDKALTARNDEHDKEIVLDINTLFFSKGNQ